MATEEQIRALAYTIWEQEGSPEGKREEHYYRQEETGMEAQRSDTEAN